MVMDMELKCTKKIRDLLRNGEISEFSGELPIEIFRVRFPHTGMTIWGTQEPRDNLLQNASFFIFIL